MKSPGASGLCGTPQKSRGQSEKFTESVDEGLFKLFWRLFGDSWGPQVSRTKGLKHLVNCRQSVLKSGKLFSPCMCLTSIFRLDPRAALREDYLQVDFLQRACKMFLDIF